MSRVDLHLGDCLDVLPALDAESIDAIVSDPPYGLGFMGKAWDALPPGVDVFRECLRVLKPGGHLIAFGGTRTYHRLACAVEDAGFEIRDSIAWVYGTGFSKGYNLKRTELCRCADSRKSLPSTHGQPASEHRVRSVRGPDLSAPVDPQEERGEVLFEGLSEPSASPQGAEGDKPDDAREGQSGLEGRNLYRAGQGVSDGSEAGSSAGEGQRVCVGALASSREDARTRAEAGRGSPPQESGPSGQQAREPGSIQRPPGALAAGALSGRGACPRCGRLRQEFAGFSTSLKPAHEPAVLARKPLNGTVAANVLEHGTGGLNIDGCRVGTVDNLNGGAYSDGSKQRSDASSIFMPQRAGEFVQPSGRFPANLIHDGSGEVLAVFPQANHKTGGPSATSIGGDGAYGGGRARVPLGFDDSGSAARFFYCAKASKQDRTEAGRVDNRHPTVKPTSLMRYLVRLVTPPGGVVLDPFMGSGSTGKAAVLEGFGFVGIERDGDSFETAKARISMQPSLLVGAV